MNNEELIVLLEKMLNKWDNPAIVWDLLIKRFKDLKMFENVNEIRDNQ